MDKKRFLFDNNNFDEGAVKAVAPVEEYIPPAPTYSEDELRAAVESSKEEAFKKGKHEGFLESEEGFSQKLLQICNSLNQNIDLLLDGEKKRSDMFQNDAISIVESCMEAALPDLMAKGDFEATLQFINKSLGEYSHESDVTIEVDGAYVEAIQNYFEENLEDKGSHVKVKAVQSSKDDGLLEAKVLWSNGGATRKPEELKENILKVMKQALAEKTSAKHNEDKNKKKQDLNKPETNNE